MEVSSDREVMVDVAQLSCPGSALCCATVRAVSAMRCITSGIYNVSVISLHSRAKINPLLSFTSLVISIERLLRLVKLLERT